MGINTFCTHPNSETLYNMKQYDKCAKLSKKKKELHKCNAMPRKGGGGKGRTGSPVGLEPKEYTCRS